MRVIKPSFSFEQEVNGEAMLLTIERYGRTCYKSENRITEGSARKFVQSIIKNGHESVLEHEKITVRLICDRGVSHEIVRHRIASYSQESTRYCNYANNSEITLIDPFFFDVNSEKRKIWLKAMQESETAYMKLISLGASPQEARSVLPNSLKTEIIITMNLREWRHFFKLRTASAAHPQMIEVARLMLDEFKTKVPVVFDDIKY
ncbi:MAG: FAD-dependent thymidylate synthase [Bacillota bacterium]|nr:FAD-dependent thymidylate synthase [Bacillota bacterium]